VLETVSRARAESKGVKRLKYKYKVGLADISGTLTLTYLCVISELLRVEGEDIVKASIKRCESERNVCKQVCVDVEDGIRCSCFDGYRLDGSACVGEHDTH
jgi:hypothetical protein